jgi:hypothetical protein
MERFCLMDAHEGPYNVVIEKSPPHMVRIAQLMTAFPGAACFAFNRDPYASCASILYRLHASDTLDREVRLGTLSGIAADWLARSDYLRRAIEDMGLLYFSYETFCARPAACVDRVLKICPELESVDCSAPIAVKDYPVQGISDQNPRQIGLLDRRDLDAVSAVLEGRRELLEYFSYTLR